MNLRSKRIALVGATLLLALPLLAFSGGFGGHGLGHGAGFGLAHGPFSGLHGAMHGEGDSEAMIDRLLTHLGDRLELSDGQSNSLRDLLEAHRVENEPRWGEMKAAAANLHEVILGDTLDEAAVRLAVQEAAAVAEELAVSHAEIVAGARTILTPEQLAELESLHGERGRRHHRMKRGGHGNNGR